MDNKSHVVSVSDSSKNDVHKQNRLENVTTIVPFTNASKKSKVTPSINTETVAYKEVSQRKSTLDADRMKLSNLKTSKLENYCGCPNFKQNCSLCRVNQNALNKNKILSKRKSILDDDMKSSHSETSPEFEIYSNRAYNKHRLKLNLKQEIVNKSKRARKRKSIIENDEIKFNKDETSKHETCSSCLYIEPNVCDGRQELISKSEEKQTVLDGGIKFNKVETSKKELVSKNEENRTVLNYEIKLGNNETLKPQTGLTRTVNQNCSSFQIEQDTKKGINNIFTDKNLGLKNDFTHHKNNLELKSNKLLENGNLNHTKKEFNVNLMDLCTTSLLVAEKSKSSNGLNQNNECSFSNDFNSKPLPSIEYIGLSVKNLVNYFEDLKYIKQSESKYLKESVNKNGLSRGPHTMIKKEIMIPSFNKIKTTQAEFKGLIHSTPKKSHNVEKNYSLFENKSFPNNESSRNFRQKSDIDDISAKLNDSLEDDLKTFNETEDVFLDCNPSFDVNLINKNNDAYAVTKNLTNDYEEILSEQRVLERKNSHKESNKNVESEINNKSTYKNKMSEPIEIKEKAAINRFSINNLELCKKNQDINSDKTNSKIKQLRNIVIVTILLTLSVWIISILDISVVF